MTALGAAIRHAQPKSAGDGAIEFIVAWKPAPGVSSTEHRAEVRRAYYAHRGQPRPRLIKASFIISMYETRDQAVATWALGS